MEEQYKVKMMFGFKKNIWLCLERKKVKDDGVKETGQDFKASMYQHVYDELQSSS